MTSQNLAEDNQARRQTESSHQSRFKNQRGTVTDKSTASSGNNKRAHEMLRNNSVLSNTGLEGHVGLVGLDETRVSCAESPIPPSKAKPYGDRPSTANRKRSRGRRSTSAGRRGQKKSAVKRGAGHRASCQTETEKLAVVDVTADDTEWSATTSVSRQKKEQKEQIRRRVGVVRAENSDDDGLSKINNKLKKEKSRFAAIIL